MIEPERDVRDPSCGMSVDPATAPTFNYHDQTFYFCSTHCAKVFSLDPAKFLRRPARPNPHRFHRDE